MPTARRGSPTPPEADAPREEAGRPRYRDVLAEDLPRPDLNPYLTSHRTFGSELLPASEAWKWRGRWDELFGRSAPLHVEVGSGNGDFLTELARRQPSDDHLGIEIRYKRVVLVARKLRAAGVTNARILRYDASYLDDLLTPGSVSVLWLNHPDPWPKARHEKNRIVSRWFLEDVARVLRPGGLFRVKSDFRDNIDRIPTLLGATGDGDRADPLPLQVTGMSDDVITGSAPWPDDIETNYQSKFRKRGLPVYAIELVRAV